MQSRDTCTGRYIGTYVRYFVLSLQASEVDADIAAFSLTDSAKSLRSELWLVTIEIDRQAARQTEDCV